MWQEPGGPLMMICAQAQTERREGCLGDEGDSFARVDVFSLSLYTSFFVGTQKDPKFDGCGSFSSSLLYMNESYLYLYTDDGASI